MTRWVMLWPFHCPGAGAGLRGSAVFPETRRAGPLARTAVTVNSIRIPYSGWFAMMRRTASSREPLNKSARARRSLCGITRRGFDERGLVIPNKRVETRWVARKGPSRQGFAGEAASRTRRDSAVATATVTRHGTHDLRLLRLKRAPRRLVQRFPSSGMCFRMTD